MRAVLFDCGKAKPQRLLIVIHHLMVDGVSWRILTEDLERLYSQLLKGETPSLPPKTHSYQQWTKALNEYAISQNLQKELSYWHRIEDRLKPLPVDFNHGPASGTAACTIAVSLTEKETTDLLQHVPKAYRTQINDILLTALVLAIGDWTKEYTVSLSLEGHGREDIIKDIDLSRTVGWFTSIFPVYLNIENPDNLGDAIKAVKETLRQIPHKGIGYGILSYLGQNTASSIAPHSSQPTLSFNYLGQWDNTTSQKGLFTFARESAGLCVSDKNDSTHLLNINSEIKGGTLNLCFTYSHNHYHNQTIEHLALTFINKLKQLIKYCCQENNFGYTPSDFEIGEIHPLDLEKRLSYVPGGN
jgi:non-ribosomal peptide synthase protein (TIGR01720 family)